ncbi:hypothetical protein BV22DRAFT_91229 [Leucogyrophana mollusca]|uniref:Uncharacterized protein n=1 Tax=Leucogyrophana mollusca TaxID=85980 RepID=A0ACB8BXD9_9AGAM|nr:hypothetical protein BV22DRAFT_91229 [Leucogyrophana mollusca]
MSKAIKDHIYNTDGNWGTSQFKVSFLTLAVQKIHFCAHENLENLGSDNQPPTNHWSIFLELSADNSVRIDLSPGDTGRPGMIILEAKRCTVTDKNVYLVTSVPPEGTTVETILKLIIDKKRDRYTFAPIGEGCRFWIATFSVDMVNAGLLPGDVGHHVRAALKYYWVYPKDTGSEERPMVEGTFF